MNKAFAIGLGLSAVLCSSGWGAPVDCTAGSLASYIGLGTEGCLIGGATFSQFTALPVITGATAISPTSVTVTPVMSGSLVGLDVQFSSTAATGQLLQALLGYNIMGGLLTSSEVSLSGTSSSGGGFVTEIQNYCLGGSFVGNEISACSGAEGSLVILNSGSDMASFSPVSTIGVIHDFTLDAGGGGSASGGLVSDRFTFEAGGPVVIPEPSTYLLMSSALAFVAFLRKRRSV